ncbi:carbon catabolite-derepressing protein kinase, putative [Entamoeba invadens IP1]|uniref:Carbon catabolite-derepressing protein kinase, putative n=1 Tax=Entamoeba invadens IP1 TaxID=370355 RepID=A0A0A1UBU2_ENTIV|nr:carbon catabolite-derepressing protein kinase, putative [Entamoeba invadens IP1]ELP92676.1 carbon catabolite-derepressing protein kinase, putative [Entamoeba invadens IP1]|eukprot:XP_004259447.1 carbon catabolite-derepressing protein kinase, putative [Entamoeba invadens IP1]
MSLNITSSAATSKSKINQFMQTTLLIEEQNLVIGKLVGTGQYGSVYKATIAGTAVALKVPHHSLEGQKMDDFIAEMKNLRGSCHRNVVLFIGLSKIQGHICIVTEFVPGDLDHLIHKQTSMELKEFLTCKFTFDMKMNIVYQCLRGIQWVHNRYNLVHRDIKPSNFLIDSNFTVKVCDFGFAEVVSQASVKQRGTPLYAAPETLNGDASIGKESDIYSLGITIWELFYQRYPFEEYYDAFEDDSEKFRTYLNSGIRPVLPREYLEENKDEDHKEQCEQVNSIYGEGMRTTPVEMDELMKSCWNSVVSKRPTINVLVDKVASLQLTKTLGNNSAAVWWKEHFSNRGDAENEVTVYEFIDALEKTHKLTLEKNELLCTALSEDNEITHYYFAFLIGTFGYFFKKKKLFKNMLDTIKCEWYCPKISREVSTSKLEGKTDGTFLIRESKSTPGNPLTLSKRDKGKTINSRIKCDVLDESKVVYSVQTKSKEVKAESVKDLVEQLIQMKVISKPCTDEEESPY